MTTRLPLQAVFTSAANIYCLIFNANGQVWNTTLNTGAGGWEVYNSANWAQYAVVLTEKTGSGYYRGTYPAAIGAVLTSEVFYNNVAPTLGDVPVLPLGQSQGQNMTAIAGDPAAAENQEAAAASMVIGQAAGVPTASVILTDLSSVLVGNYAGRSIIFTTGAAMRCAGRIVGYAADGTVTLAAPLAVAPAADDWFVII